MFCAAECNVLGKNQGYCRCAYYFFLVLDCFSTLTEMENSTIVLGSCFYFPSLKSKLGVFTFSLFSLAAFLLANKHESSTGSFVSFHRCVEIAGVWIFSTVSMEIRASSNETLKKKDLGLCCE